MFFCKKSCDIYTEVQQQPTKFTNDQGKPFSLLACKES